MGIAFKYFLEKTECDVLCIQETWLLDCSLHKLNTAHENYRGSGISGVDSSSDVLQGRPYGGEAILWRKALSQNISVVRCKSHRLFAICMKVIKDRK